MKITNRYGIPGAIVEAIKNDDYASSRREEMVAAGIDPDAPHLSVTQLINSPRIVELQRRHSDEIEEDASDRVWALMGQAMHEILERAEPSAIVEERLFTQADGYAISGKYDRCTLRKRTLQDYKFASVWEVINGLKKEREEQLNLLAELAERNGYDQITHLEAVFILRDWSKSKAEREHSGKTYASGEVVAQFDGRYPDRQVLRVPVKLWPKEQREAFLAARVRAHHEARLAETETDMPYCTRDERWQSDDVFSVRREGRKTAIKNLPNKVAAERVLAQERSKEATKRGLKPSYIEFSPGEPSRCVKGYCPVRNYCSQWAADPANPANQKSKKTEAA